MDRLDAMKAFVTAVDRGSLAAAARKLGYSAPTVTRGIALLENRLGTRLLHRSTRALKLTRFGQTYLQTCRDVLVALEMTEQGATAEHEQPKGLLTITAPLRLGQLHIRPILDAFLDVNPAVSARLLLLDRVTNLVEEGIDMAIRIARLPDFKAAVRVGEVRRILCASPSYLTRHGAPKSPAALRAHACIVEKDGAETESWRFSVPSRRSPMTVSVRPRLQVNSASAAVDSAIDGHGIARVMSYQAASAVASGDLVVLLAKYEPAKIPVHLLMSSARSKTVTQQAFEAFAVPELRDRLTKVAAEMSGKTRKSLTPTI